MNALQLALVLAVASLAPALILTCTCFARFAIVFSFIKNGLGTPGAPPNQVVVGLALFMTLFVMAPTAAAVHEQALGPYLKGQLDERAAIEAATPPLRAFLIPRTQRDDLALFYELAQEAAPQDPSEVPLSIAVPAFVLSELRTAFQMGLCVLLPFLVIELVTATLLSSLGMVMMPPSVVALPIKLLVFVTLDGWHLLVRSLLAGAVA
jgi:flagellar biosynthetic protein FliP